MIQEINSQLGNAYAMLNNVDVKGRENMERIVYSMQIIEKTMNAIARIKEEKPDDTDDRAE